MGDVLIVGGAVIDRLILPSEGLIAVMAQSPSGAAVEVGLIGASDVIGYTAFMGAAVASGDSIALSPVHGISVSATAARRASAEDEALRTAVNDYASCRIAMTERLCACAASHRVEQRLARWLLQAVDLLGVEQVDVTHSRLAAMLGVRRASITSALHLLEGERAIVCQRKAIALRDKTRLSALSCGCEAR